MTGAHTTLPSPEPSGGSVRPGGTGPFVGGATADGLRVVEAVHPGLRAQEIQVRWEVFVREQGVPVVLEVDARDFRPDVVHLVALDASGRALGVVRVIPDGGGHFHLGRLAVRREARGRGIGAELVRAVHALLLAQAGTWAGPGPVVDLDAQVQAIGFYEALGYTRTPGEVFLDAGIEHVTMSRTLEAEARH
ncbi:GNAT family N-acetyltransferase [Actinomyces sp.]|uniref:GNAT family N-acetyltransferase n=1 Tax=Actinomyces sp. TaxID=29317 RepID=UPI00289701E6|nr:GNAT family N-acetyltransferase [Actinomyces sp.]